MSSGGFEKVSSQNGDQVKCKCKLQWKFSKFSLASIPENHLSPYFSSPEKPDFRWHVGFSIFKSDDKYFNAFLKPDFPEANLACSYSYTLSVENSNGQLIHEWNMASEIHHKESLTLHRLKYSDIISNLVDDDLTFVAEVTFVLLQADDVHGRFMPCFQAGSGFLGDLSVMLGSETFSDVDISVEDSGTNHLIPAHQIILAARSAEFREKLTRDTEEKRDRQIRISDLNVDTVRSMLGYFYTDRFDRTLGDEQVIQLLKGAEKYGVSGLKNHCELHLMRKINDENVFRCLIAAELYGAKGLKNRALEIICQNRRNISRMREALTVASAEMSQEQRLSLIMDIVIEISQRCQTKE